MFMLLRARRKLGRFAYYRRSRGLGGAIWLLVLSLLKPIYFRDAFEVSVRRRGPDWSRETHPGEGTVHLAFLRSPQDYDAAESAMHPYVRRQGLREFLAEGGDRYVALTEFSDEEHPPQYVGFRMFEHGKFSIYEYGYGGALPSNFVMNLEAGIAPEFRGHRLHARGRKESYEYQDSIGVDSMVSVVRAHNTSSLRSGGQAWAGTTHERLGTFAITSWFGGLRRSTPNWEDLRQRIIGE
ncbi:MAG: hypothetical protein R3C39_00245 [Dehalococcoidia bacterium]